MKICGKCKAEKQVTEFYKHSSRPDGLQNYCKSCAASYASNHYLKNRDRILSYHSDIYAKEKHRFADYYEKNKERIAQYYNENKDRIAAKKVAYRLANPEKCADYDRNRRARETGAEGRHTADDVARIFEKQRGLCANCHAKLFKSGKQKFHVDHIIPLARGGSNWPSNLQCLCPTCNTSKHAKDPIEWAQQNGRLI